MSYLYVSEQGASIGIEANRFQVKYKDGMIKSIPAETLEMIEVFGSVQITTRCLTECLKRGVNILFYSTSGAYYGRLISTSHVNVQRQRIQAEIGHNETFKLEMSKKIIDAKIRNQVVVLRRYARGRDEDIHRMIIEMQNMQKKLPYAKSVEQVMGYEGTAAKIYFKVLGKLIDEQFAFEGRSRRPPMDPFNSLISLGYSIILNELYGKIEGKGLNPYFGVMHTGIDQPGVFLEKDGFRKYIQKLEGKFRTENRYLLYIDYSVSFRRAMDLQVNQFVKAIETENVEEYMPVIIR